MTADAVVCLGIKEKVTVKVVASHEAMLPHYASAEAAGADLKAHTSSDITIPPKTIRLIPTGLQFEIPEGFEIQVRPRSGLALKHGITVLNSPGTIDSDYRGEVGVIIMNHGEDVFNIQRGERIAQMVICPVMKAEWVEVKELPLTSRADGGFGSTGKA